MSTAITATGMACPVGLKASTACAAIRAGITRREELPYTDNDGLELVGSMLDRIPPHLPRRQRWQALARYALHDLLGERLAEILAHTPLLIAVDDEAAGTARGLETLRLELSELLNVSLPAQALGVVVGGASAGLRAIAWGRQLLQQGNAETCVVLAADSLVDARSLLRLSQQRRLLTERNPDGLTPGEAAACVLLQSSHHDSQGTILGLGGAPELSELNNDVPMRAQGLVEATTAALTEAGLALHEIDWRIADATGESFYFKEQALLPSRLLRQPKTDFPLWLTSAMLGHVGAAAGVCGVVMALASFSRGYAPGPRVLVMAGSADDQRVATIITAPAGARFEPGYPR